MIQMTLSVVITRIQSVSGCWMLYAGQGSLCGIRNPATCLGTRLLLTQQLTVMPSKNTVVVLEEPPSDDLHPGHYTPISLPEERICCIPSRTRLRRCNPTDALTPVASQATAG